MLGKEKDNEVWSFDANLDLRCWLCSQCGSDALVCLAICLLGGRSRSKSTTKCV